MKKILIMAVALIVALAFATSVFAYPNLSQKTGKPCTYCHKSPSGGKELTSAGQYYKKNGKLQPAAAPAKKAPAKKAPAAKAPTKKAPSKKAGAGKGPSTMKSAKAPCPEGTASA